MVNKLDKLPKSIMEYIPDVNGDTNTIEYFHEGKPHGEDIQVKIRKNSEGKYYISWLRYNKSDDVWQVINTQGPLDDKEKVDVIWFMFITEPNKFI